MTNPSKSSTRSDPESRRHNQPEDAPQELTVVDLSNAWNQKAQYRCSTGILHWFVGFCSTRSITSTDIVCFCANSLSPSCLSTASNMVRPPLGSFPMAALINAFGLQLTTKSHASLSPVKSTTGRSRYPGAQVCICVAS